MSYVDVQESLITQAALTTRPRLGSKSQERLTAKSCVLVASCCGVLKKNVCWQRLKKHRHLSWNGDTVIPPRAGWFTMFTMENPNLETLHMLVMSVLWFWKEEEPYKEPYNAARNNLSDGSHGSLFFAPRPGPWTGRISIVWLWAFTCTTNLAYHMIFSL